MVGRAGSLTRVDALGAATAEEGTDAAATPGSSETADGAAGNAKVGSSVVSGAAVAGAGRVVTAAGCVAWLRTMLRWLEPSQATAAIATAPIVMAPGRSQPTDDRTLGGSWSALDRGGLDATNAAGVCGA